MSLALDAAELAKLPPPEVDSVESSPVESCDDEYERSAVAALIVLSSLAEQHASKAGVANQSLADTQRAWSALEAERSQFSRQLEDNESLVRELRDNLLRGRMEHDAEVASVRQQQQLLAAQVRAYHSDLASAMKSVSAANAVLVS